VQDCTTVPDSNGGAVRAASARARRTTAAGECPFIELPTVGVAAWLHGPGRPTGAGFSARGEVCAP
jgi:hypothetical protein